MLTPWVKPVTAGKKIANAVQNGIVADAGRQFAARVAGL